MVLVGLVLQNRKKRGRYFCLHKNYFSSVSELQKIIVYPLPLVQFYTIW